MKPRRHHNNKGVRQIQRGKTNRLIDRLKKEFEYDGKINIGANKETSIPARKRIVGQ